MKQLELYARMAKARAFELALADLWTQGLISGEMHLGTGEEAIAAAITARMRAGDAVALDHRCTSVLVLLGVDMAAMLKESMGHSDGLCRGQAGHMHLMSQRHLAAASGIVGAAGPTGAGFGLAAKLLRRGSVAVAFFGDGAANQGMLLESLNLATAWSLPVIFVCKDNGWAITTNTASVTGGDLAARARGFGLVVQDVDGLDGSSVDAAAARAFRRARRGQGPSFIQARCSRLDGHFLGDPMVKTARQPMKQGAEVLRKIMAAALKSGGGSLTDRASSLLSMTRLLVKVRDNRRGGRNDPLVRARRVLRRRHGTEVSEIEETVRNEVRDALSLACKDVSQWRG
ncbi:MAG: thiamine pyrophosphate-dependent dehydrogenase E1 component subunit alpha [Deltaproteobacteria bacterium]|nr:MAG: thiamine pyrophosphate-dependent dehydrogenase E1 component subunit alpha [Deltaproteobacteria bacterium]